MSNDQLFAAIARSLREFGYADVTTEMIRETYEAMQKGEPKNEPHGIISMFARAQLEEAQGNGLL